MIHVGLASCLRESPVENKFSNLEAFRHFASGEEILFAKGGAPDCTIRGGGQTGKFTPCKVLAKHDWLTPYHDYVMGILQGRDCTVCSLKWIKHDGSAGTEAVPVEVGGEDAYFQKANYTPPHRDYMCLRVAE